MSLNWDDMRLFLAVTRAESLSGAGRILRLDPATLGRRVTRLEMQLGTPLFARSPQGYALTGAGERLLPHALAAEEAMAGAESSLSGLPGQLSGQIRIGAPDGCANFLLPRVCAALSEENPELDIQIVALPRVFNLSRREADIAIGVSAPTAGRLSVRKITDYRLHLAASEDYLARHGPVESLADLRGRRMVGYIPDMIFDAELDYLSQLGVERVALASNSVAVQFHWIAQGQGLGVVHDFAIPSAPGVRKLLPEEFSLTRSFYMVRHESGRRLERMNAFAEALAGEMRRELARLEALT